MKHGNKIAVFVDLMKRIYGEPTLQATEARANANKTGEFPKPLAAHEAGPCRFGQRRYLWTDSFAILNYISLAHQAQLEGDKELEKKYVGAAKSLAQTTKDCLGFPRDQSQYPMQLNKGGTGYVGWRIGKSHAKTESDAGMTYDGIYWHYVDKFLFALTRLALYIQDKSLMRETIYSAKEIYPYFLHRDRDGVPLGIRWKLNVDMRPIDGLGDAYPSSDAMGALITFNVLECAAKKLEIEEITLAQELYELKKIASSYMQHGRKHGLIYTTDPLGWGLTLWELQWIEKENNVRDKLCSIRKLPLNIAQLSSLPFRLYGAVLGGLLSGDTDTVSDAEKIVDMVLSSDLYSESNDDRSCPQYSIDRVMFCSCLDPWAFQRQAHEEKISLLQ